MSIFRGKMMSTSKKDKGQKKSFSKAAMLKAGIIVGALLIIYLAGSIYFSDHFYIRSKVNGVGASFKDAQGTYDKIINSADHYNITFVDGDDTLEGTFLEEALNILEDNNLDIIIGGYREIKDGVVIRERVSYPGIHIYENDKKVQIEELDSAEASLIQHKKDFDDFSKLTLKE